MHQVFNWNYSNMIFLADYPLSDDIVLHKKVAEEKYINVLFRDFMKQHFLIPILRFNNVILNYLC